jgi:CBS domain containing-hemolysin-like protein
MRTLFQRWLRSLRTLIIERLRPGRDEQELLDVIGRAEAVQSDEQRSMLEQLVEFHDKRVREVMVPRSEIHAVAVDAALSEAEKIMIEAGVSRLLVMEGDLDHILGVIHARDIIEAGKQDGSLAMTGMLRPCLRALELEQVSSLLSEMRERSCHIAIVMDEYGGTAGLVTLSDLLREIVGEIGEDGEEEEDECRPLADGSYLVRARMHIEKLGEALNMRLPQGDYDTVGGWITTSLGRIPLAGETVELGSFHIQILEADPRRISKIRLQIS